MTSKKYVRDLSVSVETGYSPTLGSTLLCFDNVDTTVVSSLLRMGVKQA